MDTDSKIRKQAAACLEQGTLGGVPLKVELEVEGHNGCYGGLVVKKPNGDLLGYPDYFMKHLIRRRRGRP